MKKKDIVLAGVGGQGILSIAATIGYAAVQSGLYLKQAEVHGMSQRGGDVQSHLRISENEIASDLIPQGKADMIISVEPMESLRYLPWLNDNGWLITNSKPFINISNYPDEESIIKEIKKIKNHVILDAETIAKDLGSSKVANMVILGAALPFIDFDFQKFEDAIKFIFGKKGEDLVTININALKAGTKITQDKLNKLS